MTGARAIAATRGRLPTLWTTMLGLLAAAVLAAAPAAAQNLTQAEAQQVIAAAAVEANARGRLATIAVVDRVGNVLGVFDMNGAQTQLVVDSQKGIAVTNGLEQVQQTFAGQGLATTPSTRASAIAKAVTGAYLSSGGNAFTTRTASQIVQEHFNPGESFSPSGPLFGVQFSQLPCSDLSTVQDSNGAGHEISETVGPKRSPLGLSADPGGLPLYKGGTLVGGVGVEVDNRYTIDPSLLDVDSDIDEIVALAGEFLFQPPENIRAHRVFVEGKSFRFTDASVGQLQTDPASASFAAVNGVLGNLVDVRGYFVAAGGVLAGQTYGTVASGFAASSNINPDPFAFVGRTVFVLFDDGGAARYPPTDSTNPATNAGGLTANEVTTILGNALNVAFAGRAQIRRPLNSFIQVTASVVDADGNVLGIARTPDGPIFGTDVSLQKARTAAFFSSTTAGTYLGSYDSSAGAGLNALVAAADINANGVIISDVVGRVRAFLGPNALQDGTAFADRTGGNLSRPFFPDGIDTAPEGPLSKPFPVWSPFNTGLQLDVFVDNIVQHFLYIDNNGTDTDASCTFFDPGGTARVPNGFQIFPGSVPVYRGGVVIGGLGVSGDGIDQDDMTSFLGLNNAAAASNTGFGNAPPAIRGDNLHPQGTHLRYVNCPFKPFVGVRARNVCAGK